MGKKKSKSKSKNTKKASNYPPKHSNTTTPPHPPPTTWADLNDDCWQRIITHLFPIDRIRLAYTSKRVSTIYNAHGPCVPIGKSLGRLAAAKPFDKKELLMLRAHNTALEEWAEAFVDEAGLLFEDGHYYDQTAYAFADCFIDTPLPNIPGFKLKSIHVKTEGSNALPWTSLEELLESEERINFYYLPEMDDPWEVDEVLMEIGFLPLLEASIKLEYEVEVEKYGYTSVVTEVEVSIKEFDRQFLDLEDEDMDSEDDVPPSIVKGAVISIGHTYVMDHVTVTINDGEPSRIRFHLPTEDDENGGMITARWLVQSVCDVLTVLLTHEEGGVDYNILPYWYKRALRRCCDRWRLKKFKKLFCSSSNPNPPDRISIIIRGMGNITLIRVPNEEIEE